VDFGGCLLGIFSAAMPVEPLHSLEAGLIADLLEILFSINLKPAVGNTLQTDSTEGQTDQI